MKKLCDAGIFLAGLGILLMSITDLLQYMDEREKWERKLSHSRSGFDFDDY